MNNARKNFMSNKIVNSIHAKILQENHNIGQRHQAKQLFQDFTGNQRKSPGEGGRIQCLPIGKTLLQNEGGIFGLSNPFASEPRLPPKTWDKYKNMDIEIEQYFTDKRQITEKPLKFNVNGASRGDELYNMTITLITDETIVDTIFNTTEEQRNELAAKTSNGTSQGPLLTFRRYFEDNFQYNFKRSNDYVEFTANLKSFVSPACNATDTLKPCKLIISNVTVTEEKENGNEQLIYYEQSKGGKASSSDKVKYAGRVYKVRVEQRRKFILVKGAKTWLADIKGQYKKA